MAKPSTLPEWDTTGVNAIEPDATHKAEGWLAPGGVPEKPPFQTFNHWMNAVWKWIKEFAQQGIVEWDGATTYQIDDIAKGSDGLLYRSLIGANTNNDPLTNLDKWIDIQWRNQTVPITFPSDADYTLTDDENAYGRILISGAVISTARNLIVNNIQKTFIVQNDEAFDVTVKTAAGTGILVPAGNFANLYNDGTNVISISQGLGISQTYQNVTASRSAGVTYTNTTGKPIYVVVRTFAAAVGADVNAQLSVDGTVITDGIANAAANAAICLSAIVPDGSTYSLNIIAGGFNIWFELK